MHAYYYTVIYAISNSVTLLYLPINKINKHFEKSNRNKYFSRMMKANLYYWWKQITDLIRSITNNSEKYDDRDKKIKFNSDDDLPLKIAWTL